MSRDRHILPALGRLRIDQIRVKDIENFRDERRRFGLSRQTVNKLITTMPDDSSPAFNRHRSATAAGAR